MHAAGQFIVHTRPQHPLIFVGVPVEPSAFLGVRPWRKSCFGRAPSHLGNHSFASDKFLANLIYGTSKLEIIISIGFGPQLAWISRPMDAPISVTCCVKTGQVRH
jgi:hypothetical protein